MANELRILENSKEIKDNILNELSRSESAGEIFNPIYTDVGSLRNFLETYKPKELVSGTNDGFVFEYKGKLYGALSTGRIKKNQKGEDRFIYQIRKIPQLIDSPYFYLALEWINDNGRNLRNNINKYDKRFHTFPTFEELIEKQNLQKKKEEAFA